MHQNITYITVFINIFAVKAPMKAVWRERIFALLVSVCWAFMLSSIMLPSLYRKVDYQLRYGLSTTPYSFWFSALEFGMIMGVSVLAGLLLVDADKIVYGTFVTLILTVIIMFCGLSLPAILGRGFEINRVALYSISIVKVFESVLLGPMLLCFLAAVFGGILGERLLR